MIRTRGRGFPFPPTAILREVLRRHFGVDDIRFDEPPSPEPSEIAGYSPSLAPALSASLVDALDLLRLRRVHRPGKAAVQGRLNELEGAEVMVARAGTPGTTTQTSTLVCLAALRLRACLEGQDGHPAGQGYNPLAR